MEIVLTDAYTMNPGDISWDNINSLGNVIIYDHSEPDVILPRIKNADIVVVNKTILTQEILSQCKKLKYIVVSATGYNNIDLKAAEELNIPISNAANYSRSSVVQHVFAMLFHVYNNVSHYNADVHFGRWSASKHFTFYDSPIEELDGKRFGIIGYGNLGQAVGLIAKSFGAEVVVMARKDKRITVPPDMQVIDKENFIKSCDVISIHTPLNSTTRHLIDKNFLNGMKNSSILINTARGLIIKEDDLLEVLQNKGIRAACLDVLSTEPPNNQELFGLKNCIITPHQAWASLQSRRRLLDIVVKNIQDFIQLDIVNNRVGY